VDYETSLVLALELSNKSWVVAAHVPGSGHVKAKQVIAPKADALEAAIERYRGRAAASGRTVERVILVYEAGYGGFWLARWLEARGMEVHVIQPSSVPVERKKRRAKSDTIDAELLLRTLLAWLRGEPRVCSMVPVPDEDQENARRRGGAGGTAPGARLINQPDRRGPDDAWDRRPQAVEERSPRAAGGAADAV
jgi:transposase